MQAKVPLSLPSLVLGTKKITGISSTYPDTPPLENESAVTYSALKTAIQGVSVQPYTPMLGTIATICHSTPDTGWVIADGRTLPRTHPLFGYVGTTYGVGNGSTTFNIPDLRGRNIVGKDGAYGTTLGGTGGGTSITLSSANLPSHTHTVPAHSHSATGLSGVTDGGDFRVYIKDNIDALVWSTSSGTSANSHYVVAPNLSATNVSAPWSIRIPPLPVTITGSTANSAVLTTSAIGNTAAVDIRTPYIILIHIIYIGV
jgi:microcystin-dependent protein